MYDSINGDDGGEIDFLPNANYNGEHKATADKMQWFIQLDETARTHLFAGGHGSGYGERSRRQRRPAFRCWRYR